LRTHAGAGRVGGIAVAEQIDRDRAHAGKSGITFRHSRRVAGKPCSRSIGAPEPMSSNANRILAAYQLRGASEAVTLAKCLPGVTSSSRAAITIGVLSTLVALSWFWFAPRQ